MKPYDHSVDYADLTTWPGGLLLDALERDRRACTRLAVAFDLASNAAWHVALPDNIMAGLDRSIRNMQNICKKLNSRIDTYENELRRRLPKN